MTMFVTARRTGGPLACEISVGEHVVHTDEPETLGGENRAPTPHQLLPAALGGCVVSMIELYARRKGWDLGEVSAEVAYDPDADPKRFDVQVSIPAALTDDQRRRLERVAETCPVRRALTGDVVVTEQLRDGAAHA